MNIRPLADRVLIKPAAAEEKTLGGIIIPDSAKEKPLKGEVVAVGNGTNAGIHIVLNFFCHDYIVLLFPFNELDNS